MAGKPYLFLATGPTGTGKTSLLRELAGKARRSLIYDPLGEWEGSFVVWTLPGLLDHLGNQPEGATVYRPRHVADQRDFSATVAAFLRYSWEVGGALFVCDEIADHCSAGRPTGALAELLARGRHYRAHLLAASQRPAYLPGLLFSGLTGFATFRHTNPRDSERVLEAFPQIEPLYRTLSPTHEYAWWDRESRAVGKASTKII